MLSFKKLSHPLTVAHSLTRDASQPLFLSLLLLVSCLFNPFTAEAQQNPPSFIKKSEEKQKSRWTLQEWLEQRDRNRMMDLWLAQNLPSPYEYYFFIEQKSYGNIAPNSNNLSLPLTNYKGGAAAYSGKVGVKLEHENNVEEKQNDLSGILYFRLMGNAYQSTNLTLGLGLRTHTYMQNDTSLDFRQKFVDTSVSLYLMKYFGIEGLYRLYIPQSDANLGQIFGSYKELGIFIDFKALRLYASANNDELSGDINNTVTVFRRASQSLGLKFFF